MSETAVTHPLEEFSAAQNGTYIGRAKIATELTARGAAGKFWTFKVDGIQPNIGVLASVRERCLVPLEVGAEAEIVITVADKAGTEYKDILCQSFGGLKAEEPKGRGGSGGGSGRGFTPKSNKEIYSVVISEALKAAGMACANLDNLTPTLATTLAREFVAVGVQTLDKIK
jgi:hypothetical protein